jgi:hypothetical protein
MHDAKTVQIPNSLEHLENDDLRALLRQLVASLGNVVKEIFPLHVLEHDVVMVARLKQVQQLNDILMLAHFEHFDLSSLLVHLNRLHIALGDGLDCSLQILRFLVLGKLDGAELTLA